jgi:hypothetical protein
MHKDRFFLVRMMGLEPIRHNDTRPSNVPVCQFQHIRAFLIFNGKIYYTKEHQRCQVFFSFLPPILSSARLEKVNFSQNCRKDRELRQFFYILN